MGAHETVLLHESLDGLDVRAGDTFVDCTLGDGGHSLEALSRTGGRLKLIGLDLDADAIARARERLAPHASDMMLVNASFREIDRVLMELRIEHVDRIMMDLGFSNPQVDASGRGFSFMRDEPLVMTFRKDPDAGAFTARDIVNRWEPENIATILSAYGDERYAWRIAQKIVEARGKKEIATTGELVEVIVSAVPSKYRFGRIHPATRTFQAIRIAVNDEFGALAEGLSAGFKRLSVGGRMAVITFHSGEDRIVKNFFRDHVKAGRGVLINKKPITASDDEISRNPRSRSAKLRVAEKKEHFEE